MSTVSGGGLVPAAVMGVVAASTNVPVAVDGAQVPAVVAAVAGMVVPAYVPVGV